MTLLDPVTDLPDDAIVEAEALIEEARERQRRRRRFIAGSVLSYSGSLPSGSRPAAERSAGPSSAPGTRPRAQSADCLV